MSITLTRAIVEEMQAEELQSGRRDRQWLRIAVTRRDVARVHLVCPCCRRSGAVSWKPRSVTLYKQPVLVEGWLEVVGYLGLCRRCGTVYWG
jgi:hypothetical protein